jgi:enoyl-CoA hydratase/3-hydroxyacyl-CoA dehydrogenase
VEAICQKYPDFKMPEFLIKQKEIGKPFVFNYVDLHTRGDIAYITINRPEAMNALNETVFAQIGQRFEEAEQNPGVKAIVFQGAGKAFVAGADIKWFVDKIKADKIDDIYAFTRKGQDLLLKIENSDKLTIALLDGLSLGGGSELALACQAIVATPAGSMGFPETAIGIFPGQGGMLRMARQVGPQLAKYYVFTGSPLNAEDLQALGIFTRLAAPGEVDSTISQLVSEGKPDKYRQRELPDKFKPLAKMCSSDNVARLLAGEPPEGVPEDLAAKTAKIVSSKAPLALKMANEIIDAQVGKAIPEAVEVELSRLHESFGAADALEGLSSFSQKRKPTYQGK